MNCKTLVHDGRRLKVKFTISKTIYSSCKATYPPEQSRQYNVGGVAHFQLKILECICNNLQVVHYILIRCYKQLPGENLAYTMKLECPEFDIRGQCFSTDDETWHLIHEKSFPKQPDRYGNTQSITLNYSFLITLTLDVLSKGNIINAPLHEDSNLTDFELRGIDGSVSIHKAVLAAASPVFHKMLTGPWEEEKKGYVDIEVNKIDLDNFKNYLYCGTLPESGTEELVLLASRYMMPELEQMCVFKLVQDLTADNAWDTLEFAMINRVTRLGLAIMEAVENGFVKVVDVRKNLLKLRSQDSDSETNSDKEIILG